MVFVGSSYEIVSLFSSVFSVSYLGAPSGASYSDWEIEGKFITSLESTAIVFRFGADVTDVTAMDDLYTGGLIAATVLRFTASRGRASGWCGACSRAQARSAMRMT